MPPMTMLETSSHVIVREGDRIAFARRARELFLGGLAGGLVGLLLLGIAWCAATWGAPAFASMARWAATIVLIASAALPIKGMFVAFARPVVFDAEKRTLNIRGKTYALHRVTNVRIQRTWLSSYEILALVAEMGNEHVTLTEGLPAVHAPVLETIAAEANALLLAPVVPDASASAARDAAASEETTRSFTSILLITLGAFWSIVGYFVMPDVVFARHDATFGFLVWPIGIFLVLAGVLDASGIGVIRRLQAFPQWAKVLAIIAWFAPYFVLSYRSLG